MNPESSQKYMCACNMHICAYTYTGTYVCISKHIYAHKHIINIICMCVMYLYVYIYACVYAIYLPLKVSAGSRCLECSTSTLSSDSLA